MHFLHFLISFMFLKDVFFFGVLTDDVFLSFLFRHCSAITKPLMTLCLWAHRLSLPLQDFPLTTGTLCRTGIRARKPSDHS